MCKLGLGLAAENVSCIIQIGVNWTIEPISTFRQLDMHPRISAFSSSHTRKISLWWHIASFVYHSLAIDIPERRTLSSQRLQRAPSRASKLHETRFGSLCISTPHVFHSRLHGDHSSPVYNNRHAAEPHESPTPLLLWALLRKG